MRIIHLEDVNPPSIDVFRALYGEDNETVDAISYYITTDIVKKQIFELKMSMIKYDIEKETYYASKYEKACGGFFFVKNLLMNILNIILQECLCMILFLNFLRMLPFM